MLKKGSHRKNDIAPSQSMIWLTCVLGILIFAFVLAYAAFYASDYRAFFLSQPGDWRQVNGVITFSAMDYRAGDSRRSPKYRPKVQYQYQDSGKRYTGDKISLNDQWIAARDSRLVEPARREYAVGRQVTVYYLAAEPDYSVLHPFDKNYALYFFPLPVTMIGFWLLLYAASERARWKRKGAWNLPEESASRIRAQSRIITVRHRRKLLERCGHPAAVGCCANSWLVRPAAS